MKYAIISDIMTTDAGFTRGPKSLRRIIQEAPPSDTVINIISEYVAIDQETQDGPVYDPTEQEEPIVAPLGIIDPKAANLREYIIECFRIPLINSASDIDDKLVDKYFFVKVSDYKWTLNILEKITKQHWFSVTTILSQHSIGMIKIIDVDQTYDVESARISELTGLVKSLVQEKTDILAESCSLQSELRNAIGENDFLTGLVQKFQEELVGINLKYEKHEKQLEQLMTPRRVMVNRKAAPLRVESLADQVVNFDKHKLRHVGTLSQTSLL